jgi:hypothetical protein
MEGAFSLTDILKFVAAMRAAFPSSNDACNCTSFAVLTLPPTIPLPLLPSLGSLAPPMIRDKHNWGIAGRCPDLRFWAISTDQLRRPKLVLVSVYERAECNSVGLASYDNLPSKHGA